MAGKNLSVRPIIINEYKLNCSVRTEYQRRPKVWKAMTSSLQDTH